MMRTWQKKNTQVNHVDDWLMTYVDMITLLLCFFVIFLIVTVSKKNTQEKPPVSQIIENVVHPVAPIQQPFVGLPPVLPSEKVQDIVQGDLPYQDTEPTEDQTPVVAELVPAKIDDTPQNMLAPTTVDQAPAKIPEPLLQTPIPPALSLSDIANNLKQGDASFEQKGDRITTLEINSAAFFDKGSATLSGAGKSILQNVAINLKSEQFKDYQITVEGHTDDTPIHTALFPSNWELSTARASAVVHYFLEQDIPARKLRAAGYADTFPKVPNRDDKGTPIPTNQAQNRRVVINLEKIQKN